MRPLLVTVLCLGLLWGCNKGDGPLPPPPPAAHPSGEAPVPKQAAIAPAPDQVMAKVDMVLVPAGPFIAGSNRVDTENRTLEFGSRRPWYEDEHPQHTRTLAAFMIDRFPVTEGDYAVFVTAIDYPRPPHWANKPDMPNRPDYPIVNVNWMDAQNYCHWRGARLPTEFEWEKAARGTGGASYPWGEGFDRNRANVGQIGDLTPVGHFPDATSPYGAQDMAGNVWEWAADWYLPYPGNTVPSDLYGKKYKVLRGGSSGGQGGHYQLEELTNRSSYRFFLDPRMQVPDVGFRCVVSVDDQGNPVDDRDAMLHGEPRLPATPTLSTP